MRKKRLSRLVGGGGEGGGEGPKASSHIIYYPTSATKTKNNSVNIVKILKLNDFDFFPFLRLYV
jgi:hypothetical protein